MRRHPLLRSSLAPRRRALSFALVAAAWLSAAGVTAACGDGAPDATTGKRITLKTRVALDPAARAPFTTALGWSIQLTRVAVATGPFYYFDGDPLFSFAPPVRRARPLVVLGIRTAFAHPGHYVTGQAMGQMTETSSAELVAGDVDYPDGSGVTGAYRSARFTFAEPVAGPAVASLEGHAVVVEGTASKGAVVRPFRANVDLKDVVDTKGEPQLDGCPFDAADVGASGTVTVTVKPAVWLDQVEFEKVPESTDGTRVVLSPDGTPFNALTRGIKSSTAYQFRYVR